ncbi:MAG: 50S ribosomal protein L18e [Candidatus Micrarchaeia archaeon]|jgi:ribosomal protein L18E
MISGPENPVVQKLVVSFQKQAKATKAPIWARVAELLLKASRKKEGINLVRLSKHIADGDSVVVPVKVLSLGSFTKKATIYALAYSAAAKAKIAKAGGKALPLGDVLTAKVAPSKVKIII